MDGVGSERSSACLEHETVAALIAGQLLLDQHPQIEAHLAECSECQSIVAAAAAALDHSQDGLVDTESFPKTGDILAGKYRVESVLGRGGMGTVFAAAHGELGRSVAIKVLHSAIPTAAARFLREAQISAQLLSEHTARVFDLGSTPEGAPFLVMEHLTGEDLSRVIGRGALSPALAVEYVLQICVALSEAHALGVVHRDLKPSNVFVTHRSDGSPCVKVLDFGISKRLIGGAGEQSHNLTQAHSVLGSPAYMSPEQLRESKGVDSRSDIWSLGIVLYELLTAKRPFDARSLSALAAAIAADSPRPPSALNASVPAALDRVVMQCLRKDPEARFASASALAEELHAALAPAKPRWSGRRGLVVVGVISVAIAGFQVSGPKARPSQVSAVASALSVPPFGAPAPPALTIHCGEPHPSGSLQFYSTVGASGPELGRRWPLDELCATDSGAARLQLARALAPSFPLSRAAVDPPHPCYQVEVTSSATEVSVYIRRTDRCGVALSLAGPRCDEVERLEVLVDGLPGLFLATPASDGSSTRARASCRYDVELPSAAYGKSLSFRFTPSAYSAPRAVFASAALSLSMERRPRTRPSLRPKPCVPPEYCRN